MMKNINKEAEILVLNGKLDGLKHYLNSLLKINSDPRYKTDLSEEMNRVNNDINETQSRLDKLNNVL